MSCRSEGCKAEVASKIPERRGPPPSVSNFAPSPYQNNLHGQRVFSKFCLKHTCKHFFEDPEGCSYKKPPYDAVCASHALCPIPGCQECRAQYTDPTSDPSAGPKYLRHIFCSDHKCTAQQCPKPRVQEHTGGPFLPFCQQHRCLAQGCKERRIEQRKFCSKHKCKDSDCQVICEDGYELCSTHNPCEIRTCREPRYQIPKNKEIIAKEVKDYDVEEYNKKQYLPFCLTHGGCDSTNCTGFRTPNSAFCLKHTCPERGCKTSSGDSHYCDAHRCESKGCESPKGWKKTRKDREKFCPLHTCRKKDCTGEVANCHLFCSKHECSKTSCVMDAIGETLCLTHLKSKCEKDGKEKAKAEMDEWMRRTRWEDHSPPHENASRAGEERPVWVQAA